MADRPEQLVLRVDRTDPSKNVVRGFHAFARFLARHPEWHGRVRMLALLDPSRQEIPDYAEYVGAIHRAAREVNDQFSDTGWTPIDLRVSDNFAQAIAAYKQYDVLLVNAIVDGMNLIAKEAPLVNERAGVLVLSENAGAHEELGALRAVGQPVRPGGDGGRHRGGADDAREERGAPRRGHPRARPRARRAARGSTASWPTSTRSWRGRAVSDSMLIVAALNGTRSRLECPKVPLTAEELAAEAKRAVDAGAGLVHVHARKKDGLPAFDLFIEDVVRAIRAQGGRADLDLDAAHARDLARHGHRALRRAARAARPRDRRRAAARARPAGAPRGGAPDPRGAASGAGVRPEPVAIGVDSLGDFETLYNDSLLSKAPYIVAELGPSDGRGSDRDGGHAAQRAAPGRRVPRARSRGSTSGDVGPGRGEPDRAGRGAPPPGTMCASASRTPRRCRTAARPRRTPSWSRWRCAWRRPSAASDGAGRRARAAALRSRAEPPPVRRRHRDRLDVECAGSSSSSRWPPSSAVSPACSSVGLDAPGRRRRAVATSPLAAGAAEGRHARAAARAARRWTAPAGST